MSNPRLFHVLALHPFPTALVENAAYLRRSGLAEGHENGFYGPCMQRAGRSLRLVSWGNVGAAWDVVNTVERFREGNGVRVEKELRVEGAEGFTWDVSGLICRRLSCLDAEVTFFRPPNDEGRREGFQYSCKGHASFKVLRELMRLEVKHGDIIKIVGEGPEGHLAVGEIAHLVSHPDLDQADSPCRYAALGPRGSWKGIPRHMFGNDAATGLWNSNFG